MGSWIVCENPKQNGYREFDLFYEEQCSSVAKKVLRLRSDGVLEVGEKHSPFQVDWSVSVTQPTTSVSSGEKTQPSLAP